MGGERERNRSERDRRAEGGKRGGREEEEGGKEGGREGREGRGERDLYKK